MYMVLHVWFKLCSSLYTDKLIELATASHIELKMIQWRNIYLTLKTTKLEYAPETHAAMHSLRLSVCNRTLK